MAMAVASSARLAFLRGAVCACCTPCTRRFPLVPVQRWSIELPGHNRWRLAETSLLVKTQGRTLDCPFTFKCQASCVGVGKVPGTADALGPAVASVVTGHCSRNGALR